MNIKLNDEWIEGATEEEIAAIELEKLNEYKTAKLNELKITNKTIIENGVEYDGAIYELKDHDQKNIMGAFLSSTFNPNTTFSECLDLS